MTARSGTCGVDDLRDAMAAGGLVLDVREPGEVRVERLPGATNAPLSSLEAHLGALARERPVYLVCRSGVRAGQAAARLGATGFRDVRIVAGGPDAWIRAGHAVERTAGGAWAMERQVRLAAGSLVLGGTLAGVLGNVAFFAIPAFVGAGLVFSGLTNTRGMARVLALMPWNRR